MATIYREGEAPGNGSAAKIGGGAIGGAILGAILGGAIVKVGSTIYDGSVKGQLQRIREAISS